MNIYVDGSGKPKHLNRCNLLKLNMPIPSNEVKGLPHKRQCTLAKKLMENHKAQLIETEPKGNQIIWISALIDGEGAIRLFPYQTSAGNVFLQAQLNISNVCEELLCTVLKIVGHGNISGESGKATLSYNTRGLKVGELLRTVRPYLIVKAQHADIILEWMHRRKRRIMYDNKDVELYTTLRELNAKGKSRKPHKLFETFVRQCLEGRNYENFR